MDIFSKRPSEIHYHILGSCGCLMAGLCRLALDRQWKVTGSDNHPSPPMSEQLPTECLYTLEQEKYLEADVVIVGNIFTYDSDVILKIRRQGISLISSMDFLQHFLVGKHLIAVCGTHGKSTTTSLVTWLLEVCGLEPSYLVGAKAKNFSKSARYCPHSKYFVLEADEYDISYFDKRSKMQTLWPDTILVNTVEFDHADIFSTFDDVIKAFQYFFRRLHPDGRLLALESLPKSLKLSPRLEIVSQPDCLSQSASQLYYKNHKIHCQAQIFGPDLSNITLCYALFRHLALEEKAFVEALSSFQGVERRCEQFVLQGIDIWFDFAHHPTAIAKFIASMHQRYGERLNVLIEKGSNSMASGVYDQALSQLEAKYPHVDISFLQRDEKSDRHFKEFLERCLLQKRPGMILTNNPYRWGQFQCVFSMLNQAVSLA